MAVPGPAAGAMISTPMVSFAHGCPRSGAETMGSGQHGGRGLDGLHRGVLVVRMGADADVVPTAGHAERRRRRRCQDPALDVPFGGVRSRRGPRMSAGVWTEASGSSRSWEFLVELRADGSRMSCWRLDRSRSRSELHERESQSSSSCVISVQGVWLLSARGVYCASARPGRGARETVIDSINVQRCPPLSSPQRRAVMQATPAASTRTAIGRGCAGVGSASPTGVANCAANRGGGGGVGSRRPAGRA